MTVLRMLLEVTIYSSILFLVILLFRAVFKKHASPAMLYAAWFLLVLRLVIPVTVGGISLIVLPAQEAAVQPPQSGLSALLEGAAGEASNSPQTPAAGAEEPAASGSAVTQAGPAAESTPAVPWKWDWGTALTALWVAGVAIVLLNMAIAKANLYKRLDFAQRLPYKWRQAALRIQDELGIRYSVRFAEVRDFDSPALSASLRPTIIIPMELLCQNDQSIEFALKHELTHLKRGDHIVCLLLMLLKAIYWFNPAVWLAARLMKMDMETACDSRVVSSMDGTEKKQYASTVLGMYAQAQPRFVLGMALGHTRQTAERRVRGIFMRQRSARGAKAAALLLAGVMLVACFTTALQPVMAAGSESISTESPERSEAEITSPSESPAPTPAATVMEEPPVVSAEAAGDYLYSITGGEATITGYTGPGGNITIPTTLGAEEYPVTAIGNLAFYDNQSITGVVIPEGVTKIEYAAFDSVINLETVSLPDSLVSIEGAAFFDTGITSVDIPINVTVIGIEEFGAFGNCFDLAAINVDPQNTAYSSAGGALFNKDHTVILQYPIGLDGTSYSIPSGVTAIGAYAFRNSSLRSVVFPGGAEEISDGAFWGCQSLESVNIPGSVTKIGYEAFVVCSSLREINIQAGVESIGAAAFAGCTSLPSIGVDASNRYYTSVDGVLFDKGLKTLLQYPAGKSGDSYSIPDTVTVIGENSFRESVLKAIIIPDGVTSIRYRAFEFCRDLRSIEIPDSVTDMDFAFMGCTSLTEVFFLGDCPATTEDEFVECSLTIYYAAGKKGYTSPWHGREPVAFDPAEKP